jgi:hypothetical protein
LWSGASLDLDEQPDMVLAVTHRYYVYTQKVDAVACVERGAWRSAHVMRQPLSAKYQVYIKISRLTASRKQTQKKQRVYTNKTVAKKKKATSNTEHGHQSLCESSQ